MKLQSGSFQGYKMNYKFNASHNFSKKIEGRHAHTFCVDLFIRKNNNSFVEFTTYEKRIQTYLKKYRGQYLNKMMEFENEIPTLEAICRKFFIDIDDIFKMGNDFTLVRLEIGDNPISSVSVGEEIIINSSNLFIPIESFQKYKKLVSKINKIRIEENSHGSE